MQDRTKDRITLFLAALGVVQIPFTGYVATMKAWEDTKPDLHMSYPDAKPFTSPISITNNSSFFDMTEVSLSCSFATRTKNSQGLTTSFNNKLTEVDIPAGKTAIFECFERKEASGFEVASVIPHVSYKTLGLDRKYEEKLFIWYDTGKESKWLEGSK